MSKKSGLGQKFEWQRRLMVEDQLGTRGIKLLAK